LKRLLLLGSAVLGLLVLVAAFAAIKVSSFLHAPVNAGDSGIDFVVESGASFRAVSDDLARRGVISNSRAFRAYARWTGKASAIHAGDYHIRAGTTPMELLRQFTSGDVTLYSFTIVEGWNHWELLQALRDDDLINATLTDEDWPGLLDELGADGAHPEGLFLPETYRFPRNTSDREVLRQAYGLMQAVLAEEWQAKAGNIPITTPYEALILASIIEKETARGDERPRISGVFTRRLEKRIASKNACGYRPTQRLFMALALTSMAT